MATGGEQEEDKANKLTCAVCLDRFRRPKLLPCFHSYCQSCVLALAGASPSFHCPACRTLVLLPPGGVSALQTNFYIEQDQDSDDTPPARLCDVCTEDRDATHSCLQCQQRYCVPCRLFHDSITATRGHTVVSLQADHQDDGNLKGDGGSRKTQEEFCPKHQNQPAVLYCLPCKSNICIQCKLTSHEGHTTEDLVDTGMKAKSKLQDRLKTLTQQVNSLEGILAAISDKRSRLGVLQESSEKDIRERADKIRRVVDECQEKTLDSLQGLNKDLLNSLWATEDGLQSQLSALTAQSEHIARVLHDDKDTDIVHLDAQLKEVRFDNAETSQILSKLQDESEPYSCEHNPLAINTAQLLEFIGVLKKSDHTNAVPSDSVSLDAACVCPGGHAKPVAVVPDPAEKSVNIKEFVYSRNTRSTTAAICTTSEQRVWIKYKPSDEGEMMALFGREGRLETIDDVLPGSSLVTVLGDITLGFSYSSVVNWIRINGQKGKGTLKENNIDSTAKTCNKVLYTTDNDHYAETDCQAWYFTSVDPAQWQSNSIYRGYDIGPIKDISKCKKHFVFLNKDGQTALLFIKDKSDKLRMVSSYSPESGQRIFDACFFPVDGQEMLLLVVERDNKIHVVDHTDGCSFVQHLDTGHLNLHAPCYLATDHDKVLWIASHGGRLVMLEI